MYRIAVRRHARLLLGSQVVVADNPFVDLRLHLRTDLEGGVVLDLDPAALRFLATALRNMRASYRNAKRSLRLRLFALERGPGAVCTGRAEGGQSSSARRSGRAGRVGECGGSALTAAMQAARASA